MCQVPAGTSVCEWTGALAPGGFLCCVREGSMSAMERTTYRRSLGSNAWAFDEPEGIRSTHLTRPGRQRISPQMIPFHCFCPISRVSLIRGNLRLWRQANGQAS